MSPSFSSRSVKPASQSLSGSHTCGPSLLPASVSGLPWPRTRTGFGAPRHALTVGFLAMMVFAIGQRVLPAFSGMRLLFSTKLMFVAMALLTVGCALRVSSEILAYQGLAGSAWVWLPVSPVTEMTAVTVFAANLFVTFAQHPPSTSAYRSGTPRVASMQPARWQ